MATLALNTPEDRARYLDEVCQGKPELRQRVEALLQAHDQAGLFLESNEPAQSALPEGPGDMIGRYKLLEQIGEGGFGVVFMAEQSEPIRRRVALKIVKPGMDSKEVIARFEAERQALALMDHPNIACVFDAGATDTGRPYFVMELVPGIPITAYCDQQRLSTNERLQLFMQVCAAVQHAHQKGIIHRDLKPTNILVTVIDGQAVPKVIDFGVAKALGQKLTEKTLFTAFQQMIGTPAYMSPEQAELSGVDVDTRSDIYSLGVLLYELLTGVTPFDADTLRKAALDEIRRLIRETEPPKPSTRLRSFGNKLTEVAQHRHTEPAALTRQVDGDLDWIAMKALEKDRVRRYETASALVEDIQNHLAHNPVVASPPSAIYRVRKFLRRHRWGVAMAGSLSLVLVLGLSAALVGYAEARRERDRALAAESKAEAQRRLAETKEKQAQTEAIRSAQVAQLMKDMLKGVGPGVALGRDTKLLRDILDQTAQRLDTDLTNQPEVEAELRNTLGLVYHDLDHFSEAVEMFQEAVNIRRQVFGNEHPDVAESLNNLAWALGRLRKYAESEAAFREALVMRRRIHGNKHPDVAASLFGLAEIIGHQQQNSADAEKIYREALAIQLPLLGSNHLDVARSFDGLGFLLRWNSQRRVEVEGYFREALRIRRQTLGDDSPEVAATMSRLGAALRGQPERRADAEALLREALAIQRRTYGDSPTTAGSIDFLSQVITNAAEKEALTREALALRRKGLGSDNPDVAHSLHRLADILLRQGKPSEAETAIREALAIRRNAFGANNADLADSLYYLAFILANWQGRNLDAEPVAREALAIHTKLLGRENPSSLASLKILLDVLERQGKAAEVLALLQEHAKVGTLQATNRIAWVLATSCEAKIRDGQTALAYAVNAALATSRHDPAILNTLAAAYAEAGQFTNAIKTQTEAISLLKTEEERGDYASRLALYECGLAYHDPAALEQQIQVLVAAGKFAEAEPLAREALSIRERQIPDDWRTSSIRSLLGIILLGQRKYAEAEPLLLSGYEGMKLREDNIPPPGKSRLKEALQRLVQLYEATNRNGEAAEWKQKLAELEKAETEKQPSAQPH